MDSFLYDNGFRHERVKRQLICFSALERNFELLWYLKVNRGTVKDT